MLAKTGLADTDAVAIKAIEAFAYLHESGSLGERDLLRPEVILRNSIIGEGDVGGPSSTTLIRIRLSGCFSCDRHESLEVVTQTRSGSTEKHVIPLSRFFSEKGEVSVPVLLYGTGCETVQVRASVAGGKVTSAASADLPFRCGE